MKLYTDTVAKKVSGFECDRCGKHIDYDTSSRTDDFCLDYTFGYGTEHDTTIVEADICDNCLIEIVRKEIPNARIKTY